MAQLKAGSTVGGVAIATTDQVGGAENLEKSFSVNGSVTVRNVVSVNNSGQVGQFPTAPQTTVHNTTALNTTAQSLKSIPTSKGQYVTFGDYTIYADQVTNDYRQNFRLNGIYFPGQSSPVVSTATTWQYNHQVGSYQWRGNVNVWGTDNGFCVKTAAYGANSWDSENNTRTVSTRETWRAITVGTTGALTVGATTTGDNRNNGNNSVNSGYQDYKRVGRDLFYMHSSSNTSQHTYRTIRTQGTTLTAGVLAAADWSAAPSNVENDIITTSNVWIAFDNSKKYKGTWNGSQLSGITSTDITDEFSDYVTGFLWEHSTTTGICAVYRTASGSWKIQTASYSATTGAMTLNDSQVIPTTNFNIGISSIYRRDGAKFVLTTTDGRWITFGLSSNNFDSWGNFSSNYSNVVAAFPSTNTKVKVITYGGGFLGNLAATIIGYTDLQWNVVGFAQSTASSGTVSVRHAGYQDGLSGLTPGEVYYVDLDSSVGAITDGTGNAGTRIGRAISSTTIKIDGEFE